MGPCSSHANILYVLSCTQGEAVRRNVQNAIIPLRAKRANVLHTVTLIFHLISASISTTSYLIRSAAFSHPGKEDGSQPV